MQCACTLGGKAANPKSHGVRVGVTHAALGLKESLRPHAPATPGGRAMQSPGAMLPVGQESGPQHCAWKEGVRDSRVTRP